MTTLRATTDHHGITTVETVGSTSSADFQQDGIEVVRGVGRTTVASADLLQDSDLITINDVQLLVRDARENGWISPAPNGTSEQPDPKLGVNTAAQAAEQKQRPATGHQGYDAAAAAIMERVEAGQLEAKEAQVYDLAAATAATVDLTVPQIVEIVDNLESGELSALDLDANTLQAAQAIEQRVSKAATESARGSLGAEGFARLSQLAAASTNINEALRGYGLMRAQGRTSDTWADFLEMAEDEMAGRV